MRENGPEYEDAVFRIATVFETLGYMVYKRVIPLHVVRELAGGVAVALWAKVGPYATEVAEAEDQSRIVEWYEWLVDRLLELEATLPMGRASVRFSDWKV